jgi:hypothetical protein
MMRNLLLVLYGDVVRDDVSGVDMSKCDSMKIIVKGMVNVGFLEAEDASERSWSWDARKEDDC